MPNTVRHDQGEGRPDRYVDLDRARGQAIDQAAASQRQARILADSKTPRVTSLRLVFGERICRSCNGTGGSLREICWTCGGEGKRRG